MSEMLKSLIGDDSEEDYDTSSYDSEEEEGDDHNEDLQVSEDVESDHEIREEITLKTLSEKNKTKKKKFIVPSNKSSSSASGSGTGESNKVMMMSEEEMEYYQNLKLYGIEGPKLKKQEQVNEEVNFSLDVLQSSKMFFEDVDPSVVTLYSTSKAYIEQYDYITQHWWRISKEKGYNSYVDTIRIEVTEPKYLTEEYSHNKSFNFVHQLLNRTDPLTCVSSDHKFMFVAGGVSGNVQHDDLIVYDLTKGRMNIYRDIMKASRIPNAPNPLQFGHFMVEFNGEIHIFADCHYIIQNIFKPQEICIVYATSNTWNGRPTIFPSRTHFSVNSTLATGGVDIFVFGGKTLGTNLIVDDLYIVHIGTNLNYPNSFTSTKLQKPRRGEGDWPSPRYGHSSCMIANLIFIYGGKNVKNQLLNDLYVFDTSTNVWTEINVESMLPPPTYKHQAFSVNNQSFYIYGGQQSHGLSNSIFRFDIVDKKWSLIEIVSDERKSSLASHQCLVAQGKLWIIGGDYGKDKPRSFVKLMNLNDPGKRLPICEYLETKRKEGYLCDLVFKLKDVKQNTESADSISYIIAHKCIVKARCSYLHEKVLSSTEKISIHEFEGTFLEEELTVVEITECSTNIFEKYLDYLYTGLITLESSIQVNQFLEFVKLISERKHYPCIQKICSLDLRKDLSLTREILQMIHKDLSSLIDDKTYSDLVIVLDQDEFNQPPASPIEFNEQLEDEMLSPLSASKIPSSGIFVHKLIVSRSPFFARMFVTSGMMESKEKVVHLTDYSKDVMMDLLRYLYTDIIQLTPRNCLGILVYCLMLDLGDLASCCRRMVSSLLDNNNVWAIHEIAVLYNEKTLESSCEQYIANHYTTLSSSSFFLELPDVSRIKIKQIYDRKNKKK